MKDKIIVVNSQDLKESIRGVVREELQEIKLPIPIQDYPQSVQQLADLFDVSRQTIYSWEKKGYFKGTPIGGRKYFFLSQIIDQLNEKRHGKSKK